MFWVIITSITFLAAIFWCSFFRTDLIDKVLIHKNRQLWAITIVIIIVFILLTSIKSVISSNTNDPDSIFFLYDIFSQNTGIYPHGENIWIQAFYMLVSLTGTILLSGAFIATITNSFMRRIDDSQNGRTRYSRLRNHDVIIGANEILISVIKYLIHESGAKESKNKENESSKTYITANKKNKIVIVSNKDIEEIHRQLSVLNSKIRERIIIYRSDISTEEYIGTLCLKKCRRIVVLGDCSIEESDAENLIVLKRVHEYVRKLNTDRIFQCFISYYDDNILLNYCCHDDTTDPNFRICPFNFHAQWADKIWGYGQIHRLMDPSTSTGFTPLTPISDDVDYSLHVVVLGLSTMAIELVKTVAKVAHFANFDESTQRGKTLVTIISDDRTRFNRFHVRYRMLNEIPDIDFEHLDFDINSRECMDLLTQYAASEHSRLYIAICSDNMSDNIILANNLPSDVYKYSVPTIVYQKRFLDIDDYVFRKHLHKEKKVRPFGAYDSYIDLLAPLDEACKLKSLYRRAKKNGLAVQITYDEAQSEWFSAHWDNVRQRWLAIVNSMYNMLNTSEIHLSSNVSENSILSIDQFTEILAPLLQRQYIAWNAIAGYTPGVITRSSEWMLKKVNTLYTLTELKSHENDNIDIKNRVSEIRRECVSILSWLYELDFKVY